MSAKGINFAFFSADEKEEGILGSILLPSFKIAPVMPEDHINRKYAFKVSVFIPFMVSCA